MIWHNISIIIYKIHKKKKISYEKFLIVCATQNVAEPLDDQRPNKIEMWCCSVANTSKWQKNWGPKNIRMQLPYKKKISNLKKRLNNFF